MDTAKRAIELIQGIERDLRRLVGEAADSGNYDVAVRITEWARALRDLVGPVCGDGDESVLVPQRDQEELSGAKSNGTTGARDQGTSRMGRSLKGSKGIDYPIFLRQGDTLIKVGWSKSQGSTYEHRAPKQVLDAVVGRAMVAAKRSETPFTAESLSNVKGHQDDIEVPGYQLYLCLAWLKRCKLIRQHGRKGYSLVNPKTFASSVEERWGSLARQTV